MTNRIALISLSLKLLRSSNLFKTILKKMTERNREGEKEREMVAERNIISELESTIIVLPVADGRTVKSKNE